MNKPKRRRTVKEPAQDIGKFAVFRHSSRLSRAHFCAIHDTYETASNEAVRLLAMSAAADQGAQHHYYVVEIAARFSAGPDGLNSIER